MRHQQTHTHTCFPVQSFSPQIHEHVRPIRRLASFVRTEPPEQVEPAVDDATLLPEAWPTPEPVQSDLSVLLVLKTDTLIRSSSVK